MAKSTSFHQRIGIILTAFLVLTFTELASGHVNNRTDSERTDIVIIDLPKSTAGDQMPAVRFLHDLHTKTLKDKKSCNTCHLQKDNQFVFKFKRLADSTTEKDMELYHNYCISCHEQTTAAGNHAGPVTGECRACHSTGSAPLSSWQPIKLERSLHFRHETSKTIQPLQPADETNCAVCHHKYDDKAQKTIIANGQEENCRYCHTQQGTAKVSSIRSASHNACVGCHQQIMDRKQSSGPVHCAGCHDGAQQKKIKIVKEIPRLKRNQPDVVLLTSLISSQENLKQHMNPVAFNHVTHEKNTESCISCHHATLTKCSTCHTQMGEEKGGFVTLEQAMHNKKDQQSCQGCHQQQKQSRDCAGCHGLIIQKPFSQRDCNLCHAVDKAAMNPFPETIEAKTALAKQTLNQQKTALNEIPENQIPETVTIGAIVNQYEAASMPHRKIVRKLASGIKNSRMAAFFHNQATTLCMGCHHNSPATTQPPKCASCHAGTSGIDQNGRPGLKGAYHGQCISCHQRMNIENPAATDCASCHKKRN